MRCVAFLRNVNQGQRGHPSTADIRGGFADAGCLDATTFQSNGTVVFDADDPAVTVDAAAAAVAARSGQPREIFWTPLATLVEVASDHGDERHPRRCEITLHGGGVLGPDEPEIVHQGHRYRCTLVDAGPGWALVRNDIEGEGHATPLIETLIGAPASSRGLPTLFRLVDRFRG